MKFQLYADNSPIGLLKGFSPLPHQLEVDVVVPHDDKRGLPGFGEFLLIELSPTEALVGRVSRYHTSGQLVTERGDAYLADLAKAEDKVPPPIMRQMLRYNLKMQLMGHLSTSADSFKFSVGERSFATLGSNVRLPSDDALAFLCNVGIQEDEHAALLGHLAYGKRVLESVPIKFSVNRLKGRRSFVFARAGYGKSNLIKYLISKLYSSPPDVGLLIFDPEGEYALPAHGKRGLANVPEIQKRLSLYTNRPAQTEFQQLVRGNAYVNFGDFPPQDIVAAFITQEKQETVFANLLRSLNWDKWKKVVDLLAEKKFSTPDTELAALIGYQPRNYKGGKQGSNQSGDVSLAAIINNLVPPIQRLHRADSKLGAAILEELKQNRVVVVDTSLLGTEDGLAISSLLLR
jgi:hypothetical protein